MLQVTTSDGQVEFINVSHIVHIYCDKHQKPQHCTIRMHQGDYALSLRVASSAVAVAKAAQAVLGGMVLPDEVHQVRPS